MAAPIRAARAANDNQRPTVGDSLRATALKPGLDPRLVQALKSYAALSDAIDRAYWRSPKR